MTNPETIDLNLDVNDYVNNAQQALAATQQLNSQLGVLSTTATGVSKALALVTPGRSMAAGFAGVTAAAARSQEQLSGLNATAAVTGQSFGKLSSGVRDLARTYPIGTAGARQMYEALSGVGVAGKGSEKTLKELSKTFVQLQGATGESGAALGTMMVQLDRAFAGGNVNAKRIKNTSDSLVYLSKNFGASASSIATFTKSIAPMANAAGIGENAALGISTAFARMGEDGYGAANAMNKMLTDLSRSVREGSGEMNTYADIVGSTADNFSKLFKMNPAEALTQVFEAINKAGTGGPRMLEQLGLDGVRTMRSLQSISASGGLRPMIQEGIKAYGGGSTETGANAAYGGLADSLKELSTAAGQAAEALGKPLLGAVTGVVNATKPLVGATADALDNDVVQKGMKYGAFAAIAATLALGGASAIIAKSMALQAATSGPMRNLIGNWALSRAGNDLTAVPNRYQRSAERAAMIRAGGTVPLMGLNRRLGALGEGLGTRERAAFGSGAVGSAAFARGGSVSPFRLLASGFNAYAAMTADSSRMMGMGVDNRQSGLTGMGAPFRNLFRSAGTLSGRMDTFGQALYHTQRDLRWRNTFRRDAPRLQMTLGPDGRLINQATGAPMREVGAMRQAGQAARTMVGTPLAGAGMMAARGLSAIMGPAGLLTAGMIAMPMLGRLSEKRKAREDEIENREVAQSLNDMRRSMGLATEATMTFADAAKAAAQTQTTIARSAGDMIKITAQDISDANKTLDQRSVKFAGKDVDEIAAQISSLQAGGLSPENMGGARQELIKEFGHQFAQDVLDKFSLDDSGKYQRSRDGLLDTDIKALVAAGSKQADRDQKSRFIPGQGDEDYRLGIPGVDSVLGMFSPGGKLHGKLDNESKSTIDKIAEVMQAQYELNEDAFGTPYADKARQREMDAAAQQAKNEGNGQYFFELTERLGRMLDPNAKGLQLEDMTKTEVIPGSKGYNQSGFSGGDVEQTRKVARSFTETLMEANGIAATRLRDTKVDPNSPMYPGVQQEGKYAGIAREAGLDLIQSFYDNRGAQGDREVNRETAESVGLPGDVRALDQAVNAQISSAVKTGDGLEKLAQQSVRFATAIGNAESDMYKRQMAVAQRAQEVLEFSSNARTTGENLRLRGRGALDILSDPNAGKGETGMAMVTGARETLMNDKKSAEGMLKAFLQQQREYNISVERANRDFQRQQEYAAEDFQTQMLRQEESFELQKFRTKRNYDLQRERSEADYQRNVRRMTADFNLQMKYSIEDYNIQRARSQRAFDRQLKRMAEDSARDFYSPYQRIRTQAVWDAQNLMVNLNEQAAAMKRQREELDQLGAMGINTNVIDMLGLSKAENAQQLSQFVRDLMTDPGLIAEFNKSANVREKLGKKITQSEDNVDFRRMKEDYAISMDEMQKDFEKMQDRQAKQFDKTLSRGAKDFRRVTKQGEHDFQVMLDDMLTDYNIAVGHAEVDYAKAMNRMSIAFDTQMTDMAKDFALAQTEITGDLNELAAAANGVLAGEMDTMEGLVKNSLDNILAYAKEMGPKIGEALPDFMGSSGGSSSSGDKSMNWLKPHNASGMTGMSMPFKEKGVPVTQEFGNVPTGAMKGKYKSGKHTGVDYGVPEGTKIYSTLAGQVITAGWNDSFGNYVLVDHGKGRTLRYGHFSKLMVKSGQEVDDGQLIGLSGSTGLSTGPHLHYEARVNGAPVDPRTAQSWMAKGGVLNHPTFIGAGEGGPEAVIPLDNRGIDVIAQAMSRFADRDILRGLMPGRMRESIVYHGETITYDQRNDFGGANFTVMSSDPNDMARKLEAKTRKDNLTKTKVGR